MTSPNQVLKTYTFYLNSLRAQSKTGSDVNFLLPSNLVVGNAANQFQAYVNEVSIPSYPIVINASNKNNVINMKLQAFVVSTWSYNNLLSKLEVNPINQWFDCNDVQNNYINNIIDPILNPWGAMFATSPQFTKSPTSASPGFTSNSNWTSITATIPDGVYVSQAALVAAANTAIQAAVTGMNNTLNYLNQDPPGPYNPANITAAYLDSPRALSPSAFILPNAAANFQLSLASSGTKSAFTFSINNNFGIQSNFGDQFSLASYTGIIFGNYRMYFYESEILSMLGWPDQDFFLEAAGVEPVYDATNYYPNYYDPRPAVTYTSLRDVNVNPNVCTYVSIPSLTQQNALISDPIATTMSPTTAFCAVFNDPTLPRTATYYSFPIKIQVLDKILNQFTVVMLDYRNRPIPYDYFQGPFFLELIVEEILNPSGQLPALNVSQLNSLESNFFQQKQLELELQMESFIRTKALDV